MFLRLSNTRAILVSWAGETETFRNVVRMQQIVPAINFRGLKPAVSVKKAQILTM